MKMTLGLVVQEVGKSGNVVAGLRGPGYQGLVLTVEIKKPDGTSVSRAAAAIKDWQASQSSQEVVLWHEQLRDVRFYRSSAYEISIQVLGTETDPKALVLQPLLAGGGNELP